MALSSFPINIRNAIVEAILDTEALLALAHTNKFFHHAAMNQYIRCNIEAHQESLNSLPEFQYVKHLGATENLQFGADARSTSHTAKPKHVILGQLSCEHILFKAAKYNKVSHLKRASDLNINVDGLELLYVAISNDSRDVVAWLIKRKYFQKYLHGGWYYYVMQRACLSGSEQTIRLFLGKGYGFSKNPIGIIESAICSSSQAALQALYDYGAKTRTSSTELEHLLLYALWVSNTTIYRVLIQNGANFAIKNKDGLAVFEFILQTRYLEDAEFMLDQGASVDTNFGTTTPLIIAAAKRNYALVELLLRNGADPNFRPANCKSSLYRSIINRDLQIAAFLLEHGASLDWCDGDDESPLMTAVRTGNFAMVRLLLRFGRGVPDRMLHILVDESLLQYHPQIAEALRASNRKLPHYM